MLAERLLPLVGLRREELEREDGPLPLEQVCDAHGTDLNTIVSRLKPGGPRAYGRLITGVAGALRRNRRGNKLTGESLHKLWASAWDGERYRFDEADFEGKTFEGPINFKGARFRAARFSGATFCGRVTFDGALFMEDAWFDSVTFEGTASFVGARFLGRAWFEHPDTKELTEGWPEEVTFHRWADFQSARFVQDARFGGASFDRRARFAGARFDSNAIFTAATFNRARTFGPIEVADTLVLSRAFFEAPVTLEIAAKTIVAHATHFRARTTIELKRGRLWLDDADFAQPSIVEGRGTDPKPRVMRLHRANIGQLTLADLDLRDCGFVGAHNLDGLRFEGGLDFPAREGWWRTDRRVIDDEVRLRERGEDRELTPTRVARTYRALRKGREDNKDEPGAADFYYGEMEMRRRASSGFERIVVTLYWLVSGYGLRASRALVALALTVFLFAWGLDAWGFTGNPSYGDTLLFSAESTSSLFRAPTPPAGATLKDAGHVLQIGLRLLGPLFFGLALLALRGRVKR